jgi:8-oxo-dGTP pyrophosphatase MutT (NUDIX family)
MTMNDLSIEEVAGGIRAALAARPARHMAPEGFDRAAVLVPVLARPGGPTVLFTRRTESVRRHRGEISFPGGHQEEGEGPLDAALREAQEEVSLDPGSVEILGALDERPSVTRYVVAPFVGLVRSPPQRFDQQEREVREVFEVPLSRLAAPDMPRGEWWDVSRLPPEVSRRHLDDLGDIDLDRERLRYRVWFYDVAPDRIVWGLTARILKELLDRTALRAP